MREAAEKLDFERAIELRDTIAELNNGVGKKDGKRKLNPENEGFEAKRF